MPWMPSSPFMLQTETGLHSYSMIWMHTLPLNNRLCNLELSSRSELCDFDPDHFVPNCEGISLYQAAIDQLPNIKDGISGKRRDYVGDEEDEEEFIECHWPPCCHLRFGGDGFVKCKRCGCTYYCGLKCRQLDWVNHKKHCRRWKKRKLIEHERHVER
ncbi:hypothetical protein SARC_06507 [Sphaeroforma arctica JP610]|uniref:MYND-type domain-containing protein n=1 Tax=Sphaeroforma arctica JP610 TaxID=667725 RepID=A0A0L0FWF1_9EUKA|nr:hypothetical protein SARC_06507 [Sphaeroforma arctica JP610]KNC81155.1 hypothetical protein SARC_06507 [Sphaeroforma arctica JP610]|eukprot:XP_014155057.1 hypothetical protein SARC_06507 [Sphaeroforma arctica JP610]